MEYITEDYLHGLFAPFGKIQNITIHREKGHLGYVFAFVDFYEEGMLYCEKQWSPYTFYSPQLQFFTQQVCTFTIQLMLWLPRMHWMENEFTEVALSLITARFQPNWNEVAHHHRDKNQDT